MLVLVARRTNEGEAACAPGACRLVGLLLGLLLPPSAMSCRGRAGGGRAHILAFRVISLLLGPSPHQATPCAGGPLSAAGPLCRGGAWREGAEGARRSAPGPASLFDLPLHPPRHWSETCQAPPPLTFLSKLLSSSLRALLLKYTISETQMGAAKSSSPSMSLRPPRNCSSR